MASDLGKGQGGVSRSNVFVGTVALVLYILPWQGVWLVCRPDFGALAVLYWMHRHDASPPYVLVFAFGLLFDVADGVLLGTNAISLSLLAHFAIRLGKPFAESSSIEQSVVVGGLAFLHLSVVWALLAISQLEPAPLWLAAPSALTSILLWPLGLVFLPRLFHEAE